MSWPTVTGFPENAVGYSRQGMQVGGRIILLVLRRFVILELRKEGMTALLPELSRILPSIIFHYESPPPTLFPRVHRQPYKWGADAQLSTDGEPFRWHCCWRGRRIFPALAAQSRLISLASGRLLTGRISPSRAARRLDLISSPRLLLC